MWMNSNISVFPSPEGPRNRVEFNWGGGFRSLGLILQREGEEPMRLRGQHLLQLRPGVYVFIG